MGRFTKKFDKSYDFSNVALFPWTPNSLDTLWDGEYTDREANEWTEWESVVGDLYGAIAGVGNHKLHVKTHKYKYSVDLPEQKAAFGVVRHDVGQGGVRIARYVDDVGVRRRIVLWIEIQIARRTLGAH